MKLHQRVHKKLVSNLKKWRNRVVKQIDIDILLIEDSQSQDVEHLMYLKSEMLIRILNDFCLGHDECYFCLKYLDNKEVEDVEILCQKCEFGNFNGICFKEDSLYQLIHKRLSSVKEIFTNFYSKFSDR